MELRDLAIAVHIDPKKIDRAFPDPYSRGSASLYEGMDPDDMPADAAARPRYEPGEEDDWMDTVREQWAPAGG